MIDDPETLAKSMMRIYGDDAEQETRRYALMLKERGRRDHRTWVEAAEIIDRHKILLRGLDA